MVKVSEPLKELPHGGSNSAALVKDCTEMYLGMRGIELLAGFEQLVNLEVLWVNDNRLAAITNLDASIRIKQLYAHRNRICTLKGSLQHLKFLTHLDLSGNQLRDLQKVIKSLARFSLLTELNLKDNPCCEEPQYRLQLIHALPSLQVLDLQQITTQERTQAAGLIGGDVATLTVAFGRRVPPPQQPAAEAADSSRGGRLLEQELFQLAESIRDKQMRQTQAEQDALYASNPDADYFAPRAALPPPPGVLMAQAAWKANCSLPGAAGSSGIHTDPFTACWGDAATEAAEGAAGSSHAAACGDSRTGANVLQLATCNSAHRQTPGKDCLQGFPGQLCGASLGLGQSSVAAQCGQQQLSGTELEAAASSYVPRDVLVLSSCCKWGGPAGSSAAPHYTAGTFGHRLTVQTWEAEPRTLKL